MSEPFNKLTPAEAERLALLSEECGEVVQAIGKILRHGYGSYHPADPGGLSNRQMLERELGDLAAAVGIMNAVGDIEERSVDQWMLDKLVRVRAYLHHQPGEP